MTVYHHPANVFVAEFIGTPAMNVLPPASHPGWQPHDVIVGIRPQDISMVPIADADETGRVEVIEPLGSTMLLYVHLDSRGDLRLRVLVPADAGVSVDASIGLQMRRNRLHRFDPTDGRALPAPGL
jgi:ABC-type sugar transport system ATPase subunit